MNNQAYVTWSRTYFGWFDVCLGNGKCVVTFLPSDRERAENAVRTLNSGEWVMQPNGEDKWVYFDAPQEKIAP